MGSSEETASGEADQFIVTDEPVAERPSDPDASPEAEGVGGEPGAPEAPEGPSEEGTDATTGGSPQTGFLAKLFSKKPDEEAQEKQAKGYTETELRSAVALPGGWLELEDDEPAVVVPGAVPEPPAHCEEVETYPIHPPYAHVRILWSNDLKENIYEALEPRLTATEKKVLDFIEDTIINVIEVAPESIEGVTQEQFITDKFNDVIFDYSIVLHDDEQVEEEVKKKLLYYIKRDFIGHGPIDILMEDPFIEDISCDGPHQPIFLYHRKYESLRTSIYFGTDERVDGFVIKLAQRSGKHISIAEPILDATMSDGSRLQATLSHEVSAGGSTFTIRKFRPEPFTPPDLVLFKTQSPEMLAYLWIAVQNGASLIYAGGTASGKTTSMNAILLFIPPQMKIVSIEDTRELNLPHPNWIAGITRSGFGPRNREGHQAGEIDMFQLLKNALRQRPEYIVVGEVRGKEAYNLFQAMATGHAAYGTMHADSVDAVIHRLESDPINIPRTLLEALDVVSIQIQTRVNGKRVRRTKQIAEIVGLDPHTKEILTNEVFHWVPRNDTFKYSGVSYVLERIQLEKGMTQGEMQKELERRAAIIRYMVKSHIQDYKSVSSLVTAYYKDQDATMKMVLEALGPEDSLDAPLPEGAASDRIAEALARAATPEEVGQAAADDAPGVAPEAHAPKELVAAKRVVAAAPAKRLVRAKPEGRSDKQEQAGKGAATGNGAAAAGKQDRRDEPTEGDA